MLHSCCKLPHLLPVIPTVASYPTCCMLPHLLQVTPSVASYPLVTSNPTCCQLRHLLPVTPPVASYPFCCKLPPCNQLPHHVASYPICCRYPSCCKLPFQVSDALVWGENQTPRTPCTRRLPHAAFPHCTCHCPTALQYTVPLNWHVAALGSLPFLKTIKRCNIVLLPAVQMLFF